MTAQFAEILHLRGEKLSLCSQPLDGYLDSAANPIKFESTSTALWRGYHAPNAHIKLAAAEL